MGKTLSAEKVKKLPEGTVVLQVDEKSGKAARLWIVKSGRKKVLRGIFTQFNIKDREGWHYELAEAGGGNNE